MVKEETGRGFVEIQDVSLPVYPVGVALSVDPKWLRNRVWRSAYLKGVQDRMTPQAAVIAGYEAVRREAEKRE